MNKYNFITLRPDFTSKIVHVLAFGTPKFYIAPYDKIKHELVNLSSNCDVKSGLRLSFTSPTLDYSQMRINLTVNSFMKKNIPLKLFIPFCFYSKFI